MSQKNAQGIDVSAEEERYLRTAFRRFALPYVLVFATLAWFATWLGSDAEGASPEAVSVLEGEVAGLKASLDSIDAQLATLGGELERTGGRLRAVEGRETPKAADPALERKLRDAAQRIGKLERQLSDQAAGERLDALAARMTRLEQRASAPAAPARTAPGPAAPAGRSPAAPTNP